MLRYLCIVYFDCWRVWYISDYIDRCRMVYGLCSESFFRIDYWWSCCDIRLCLSSIGRRFSRFRIYIFLESYSKVFLFYSYIGFYS